MDDYSAYTDQQLADLLRLGDEAAFKIIYDKYWPKLYFVAAKRLNDNQEAEEVVQDIFLNLWKKRAGFQLKVNFDHYLAVAVKFEVFKHRAARVKQEALAGNLGNEYNNKVNTEWDRYDMNTLQKHLEQTIQSLPAKCKLVFTMSRETDLTNKQIASKLEISEKAVEKHITHALKILKSRFGHYFIFIMIVKGWY
jgi:RNA polymerase sigma-70 factor (ECF subfamily)